MDANPEVHIYTLHVLAVLIAPQLRTLAQLMTAVGIEGAHENSPEVAAVARALRDLTSPKNRSPFRPLPPRLAQVLNGHSDSEHVIEDHVTESSDHVLESDSEHDVNALKDKLKRVKDENHVLTLVSARYLPDVAPLTDRSRRK